MEYDLSGRTALVCGSTQGIGLASARELARCGARVILVSRNSEKLDEVCTSLNSEFPNDHIYRAVDFSDWRQVENTANGLVQDGIAVHILVNNSGGPAAGPIATALPDEFIAAFNQHLVCSHVLMQAFLPGMKAAGFGRIINIISTSVKQPLAGLGVSNTVRAAVGNWSKTLASELGPFGITVNNILPGATLTGRLEQIIKNKAHKSGRTEEEITAEMLHEIPAARFAKPEETAAAVAFIASDNAAYINGINLPVDGGRTGNL
jgi:3-oxoacyl-[acyl-carrier protein] reductase